MVQELIWLLLAIIIIFVLYLIYRHYYQPTTTLTSSIYLNESSPTTIGTDKIINPTSTHFSMGCWVYVNSWNTNNLKYVFSAGTNDLVLYFDRTNASLLVDIKTATSCSNTITATKETVQITNNFPLQKWVYVIVSINGNYVDCYLDGKMITSYQMQNAMPVISCNPSWSILMGSGFDAYVYNFIRVDYVMTPKIAQSNYLTTGPKNKSQGLLSNYNVNINVVKDGTVERTMSVF